MPRIVPIHWKKLEKFFMNYGYKFLQQTVSHRTYTKPGTVRPIVIPAYKEEDVFIIQNNFNTAGISKKDYLIWIEKN